MLAAPALVPPAAVAFTPGPLISDERGRLGTNGILLRNQFFKLKHFKLTIKKSHNNCFLGGSSKSDFPFFKEGCAAGCATDFLLLLGLFDFDPGAIGDLGDLDRGDLGDSLPSLFASADLSSVFSSPGLSLSFSSSSGFLSFIFQLKKI